MGARVHAVWAFGSWTPSRGLDGLRLFLASRGYEEACVRSLSRGKDRAEAFAGPGAPSLGSVSVDPLLEEVFFDACAVESPAFDFNVRVPTEDQVRDGESWPIKAAVSDKMLALFRDSFSFESFAEDLHVELGASKTLIWSDYSWSGSEEEQAALQEITELAGGDPVFHPGMDFVIFDPKSYEFNVRDRLEEIYRRFCGATSQPMPDLPMTSETLANGHVVLKVRPFV